MVFSRFVKYMTLYLWKCCIYWKFERNVFLGHKAKARQTVYKVFCHCPLLNNCKNKDMDPPTHQSTHNHPSNIIHTPPSHLPCKNPYFPALHTSHTRHVPPYTPFHTQTHASHINRTPPSPPPIMTSPMEPPHPTPDMFPPTPHSTHKHTHAWNIIQTPPPALPL